MVAVHALWFCFFVSAMVDAACYGFDGDERGVGLGDDLGLPLAAIGAFAGPAVSRHEDDVAWCTLTVVPEPPL